MRFDGKRCAEVILYLNGFQFFHPSGCHGIAWHFPIASGREGNGADLGGIGRAGALELLCEEAAIELLHPFHDGLTVKFVLKRARCHTVKLIGSITLADGIVKEEVVEIVRSDDIFGLLRDLAVLGGKKLGADGRLLR